MYHTLTFDIRKKDVTKHDGYKSINILQDSLNYTYLIDYKNILYDCNLRVTEIQTLNAYHSNIIKQRESLF